MFVCNYFFVDPFCLAKLASAFHSVMFHPIEPRLVVTANSKEGVSSWDVRMPKRFVVIQMICLMRLV